MGVRVSAPTIKPREQWDSEDRLDYLDGWHEESGIGFRSTRNRERVVRFEVAPTDETNYRTRALGPTHVQHPASALFALGRDHRIAHKQATGI